MEIVIWNLQENFILSLIFRCDNKSFVIQNEISALTNIVKKGKISLLLKEASRPFPAPSLLLDDQDEDSLTCLAESEGRNAANISKGSELQNLESFKIQFNLVFVCLCMHHPITHYYFPGSCHCLIDVLNQYQHNKDIWRPSSKLYHEKQKFCLLIRFCSVIVSENPHKSFYWIWT